LAQQQRGGRGRAGGRPARGHHLLEDVVAIAVARQGGRVAGQRAGQAGGRVGRRAGEGGLQDSAAVRVGREGERGGRAAVAAPRARARQPVRRLARPGPVHPLQQALQDVIGKGVRRQGG
jgi:hypothetical protein